MEMSRSLVTGFGIPGSDTLQITGESPRGKLPQYRSTDEKTAMLTRPTTNKGIRYHALDCSNTSLDKIIDVPKERKLKSRRSKRDTAVDLTVDGERYKWPTKLNLKEVDPMAQDLDVDEDAYLRDFLFAVETRDLERIQFLMPSIKANQDKILRETTGAGGYYELAMGNSDNIEFVLSEGLLRAAHYGSVPIVEFLIESGANVNAKNSEGLSPLMRACEKGHLDVAQTLMDAGANVNQTSNVGFTALHYVSRIPERWQSVEFLLRCRGVENSNDKHKFGLTPLHCASERDVIGKSVFLLLKIGGKDGARQNAVDKYGRTPLHIAVERQLHHNVQCLIEFGAHVNIQDAVAGSTPLHEAAKHGNAKIASLLIANGADVTIVDKHGQTAKDIALQHGALEERKRHLYEDLIDLIDVHSTDMRLQEQERLREVFYAACKIIPDDGWDALAEDLFNKKDVADSTVYNVQSQHPHPEGLPSLSYHTLCAWIEECPLIATFWVLIRSLRDTNLNDVADELVSSFA
ncbi:unnamed protein product [Owenia fusiformis]|uniref:Uncharacterized protein n=1 Tax=Owenia fusiformis TaxID=6347 RepID=A0A8J1UY48_OWEFU|nr:unnamed protein product [Owenia fusiformis]